MKNSKNMSLIFMAACWILIHSGCFTRLYIHDNLSSMEIEKTRSYVDSGARVVIHYSDSTVLLMEASVNRDIVSGKPVSMPFEFNDYKPSKTNNANLFKNDEVWLIPTIHIYTNEPFSAVNGFAFVNREKINRYDFYQSVKHRMATANSLNRVVIGISALVIGIILAFASHTLGRIGKMIKSKYGKYFLIVSISVR